MLYRRFGRTNLNIPVFSTGGMRYQDGWKDKPLDEVDPKVHQNLEATIARSLELGARHIETARGYGVSERQLGVVLPTYPREDLIVQTKVGPAEDPDEFTANFMDSLARLQLEYVDLLAIHGINDAECLERSIRKHGCLAAARELQRKGLCRHVGFSTHGPLDVILKAINHPDDGGFDYVNLHWYYIFQRNWPAIEAATAKDMGVFIISPSDKGGKLYDPPPSLRDFCRPLHPITFNDLWCLSHPQVHTLSVGAARPSDYDEHLDALPLLDRADEVLSPIVRRWEDAMRKSVGEPSPECFTPGLPRWEDTPGELNLEMILWLRNLVVGWDMSAYGKMRFNLMGNGGHWFAGAKVAEAFESVDRAALVASVAGHPRADEVIPMIEQAIELMGAGEVKRASES